VWEVEETPERKNTRKGEFLRASVGSQKLDENLSK
jgi:hypothetical protein